ncbi:UDP-glucose 6-dehydrogenase [Helicobacter valdiviensis]|uniref:UDP-glucose 6-dehydrogenase n=1 Tax=Helicobacter valdiviensis TaxID=1458358 RepID=A0A2W6MXL4_9HELI|nr:UDP-glucose/GDP-mannose dehydrogenase family protein [Helicobacter valdiviensis]PZT48729.1 UDP-glucose 6-dehydrogenase [Helicobacter valdiviensis]
MNITVVGSGYVGLVSGACFAEMGNRVHCIDVDRDKIEKLKKGIIPIYEPGLEEIVLKNIENKNLFFSTDLKEGLENCSIVFLAVGTPTKEDGGANLEYLFNAAKEIGKTFKKPLLVVNKSTVPVGSAQEVKKLLVEALKQRGEEIEFSVASNPEFLKEGDAVNDFLKPDRIVIGADDTFAKELLSELYAPFSVSRDKIIYMDIKSAEMTKYAANAMLATKISFMNEIANICERVGANINDVRKGIGSDKRIGYSFIYAGCGYGGSCFPKDVRALIKSAEEVGINARLVKAVEKVNEDQKRVLSQKIIEHFGEDLSTRCFALWGLSFKPETDDMREATSIVLIHELIARGACFKVYDPKAMQEAQKYFLKDVPNVCYKTNKYDTLDNCDAMILVTEWKEFRSPDFEEIKMRLKSPIIFDGRNQYNGEKLRENGIIYYGIGVK